MPFTAHKNYWAISQRLSVAHWLLWVLATINPSEYGKLACVMGPSVVSTCDSTSTLANSRGPLIASNTWATKNQFSSPSVCPVRRASCRPSTRDTKAAINTTIVMVSSTFHWSYFAYLTPQRQFHPEAHRHAVKYCRTKRVQLSLHLKS